MHGSFWVAIDHEIEIKINFIFFLNETSSQSKERLTDVNNLRIKVCVYLSNLNEFMISS